MQVPHDKEVAIHVVPESCVARREVRGEALTGVRTGQPLSHDSCIVPGADAVQNQARHCKRLDNPAGS